MEKEKSFVKKLEEYGSSRALASIMRIVGLLRVSLSCLCWIAPCFPAFAGSEKSVAIFGTPPNFFKYLRSFDDDSVFLESRKSYLGSEADIVVVFARNREDNLFVPAGLFSAFKTITSAADSFVYMIPRESFHPHFDADVVLVLTENLKAQMPKMGGNITDDKRVKVFSCYSAGKVWNSLPVGKNTWSNQNIVDHCLNIAM